MTELIENENGQITLDEAVIEEFAGHAALNCFGIVGMAAISVRDGLAKLLNGSSVRKGVSVEVDEKRTHRFVPYHSCVWSQHTYGSQ